MIIVSVGSCNSHSLNFEKNLRLPLLEFMPYVYIYIFQELKRSQKGQAHTNTWKLNRDISTGTAVFLNRKRVNVCEHTTKTASLENLRKVPPGGCERDGWREII